jgi:pimeloyl-ACP methyl ester carboxylesterase
MNKVVSIQPMLTQKIVTVFFAMVVMTRFGCAQDASAPPLKHADLNGGIRLSYIETGEGTPVIFIHGTLGDLYMWTSFVETLGEDYRAIAYSRRYNYPNKNSVQRKADHSTAIEARDLAEFISKLELPPAHIVGYSYGGYTALHLAVNHPELVRTLVVAEPPLLPWLANMSENQDKGKQMLKLQETRFVKPAREALKRGNEKEAMRSFIDYVIREGAFESLPDDSKKVLMRNAPEFVAEVRSKNMFAPLSRDHVASLPMPVLMISGANSIGPLRLTDAELEKALPKRSTKRVTIANATHGMWYENPTACTNELLEFFKAN